MRASATASLERPRCVSTSRRATGGQDAALSSRGAHSDAATRLSATDPRMGRDATNVAGGGSNPSSGTSLCDRLGGRALRRLLAEGPGLQIRVAEFDPLAACSRRDEVRLSCALARQRADRWMVIGLPGSNPRSRPNAATSGTDARLISATVRDRTPPLRRTAGCSSGVRARGRGPRGRWCDSSHSDDDLQV